MRISSSTGSLPGLDLDDMSPRTKKRRFSLGRLSKKSPRDKHSPRGVDSELDDTSDSPRGRHRRSLSLNSSGRSKSKTKKGKKGGSKHEERRDKQLGKIEDSEIRKCIELQDSVNLERLKNLYDLIVSQADDIEKLRADLDKKSEAASVPAWDARRATTYRPGSHRALPTGSSNAEYYPMYMERPPPTPLTGIAGEDAHDDDSCRCIIM